MKCVQQVIVVGLLVLRPDYHIRYGVQQTDNVLPRYDEIRDTPEIAPSCRRFYPPTLNLKYYRYILPGVMFLIPNVLLRHPLIVTSTYEPV